MEAELVTGSPEFAGTVDRAVGEGRRALEHRTKRPIRQILQLCVVVVVL
jgi:hypothetical protein